MDAAILPVKNLRRAKSRLGTAFAPAQRLALAEALLHDALALCEAADFLEWSVVTDDDDVEAQARARGFAVVRDPGTGLNDAVATALDAIEASSLSVIPVDVPLAWKGDIQDLIDTAATSDVVVVPSARDGGTNALCLTPPDAIAPRFGQASLRHHINAAEERGLRCSILSLPRLELDLDTIDDVDEILARRHMGESRAIALLRELRS